MADEPNSVGARGGSRLPSRWWQWILLYPTLAISLVTAAPQWVDKILAAKNDVKNRPFSEAILQHELYRKNLSCTALPFNWYSTPENISIDATVCTSGDVYVRAQTPNHEQFFYFVPVERVIGKPDPTPKSTTGEAQAAEILPIVSKFPHDAFSMHADNINTIKTQFTKIQNVSVVCTRFIDQRYVLRHLFTPQGCIDQIIDTFNGMVVRSSPVPCRPGC